MKNALEYLQCILEEKKIEEDYKTLKLCAKIKIKIIYHNGYECFDYFNEKSDFFFREIERLKRLMKNGFIKDYEIINN